MRRKGSVGGCEIFEGGGVWNPNSGGRVCMEAHHRDQNGEAEPMPVPVHHQNGYGHGHEPPKDARNVMEHDKAEEAETHDNKEKKSTEEEVEEEKKVGDDGADSCTTSPSSSKGVGAEELRSENASKDAEVKKDKGHNPKEGGGKASSKGKEPANSNSKGTARGPRSASSNGRENGKGSRGESKACRKGAGAKNSETIGANGLPSMQRSKSTPSRRSAAAEEGPPVVEAFVERMERPSSGDIGAKLVALLTQWLEYREPALIVVKNFWLQLRTRVEFRVKQAWPSVRVLLLLVTRIMLMLSLLGLESAKRGFSSLFYLGSAAYFLLLWCAVLNFIALAGFFNLLIALVSPRLKNLIDYSKLNLMFYSRQ